MASCGWVEDWSVVPARGVCWFGWILRLPAWKVLASVAYRCRLLPQCVLYISFCPCGCLCRFVLPSFCVLPCWCSVVCFCIVSYTVFFISSACIFLCVLFYAVLVMILPLVSAYLSGKLGCHASLSTCFGRTVPPATDSGRLRVRMRPPRAGRVVVVQFTLQYPSAMVGASALGTKRSDRIGQRRAPWSQSRW